MLRCMPAIKRAALHAVQIADQMLAAITLAAVYTTTGTTTDNL
jgi:hypothetical protein